MTTPRERIAELARAGRVSEEDARRLLASVEGRGRAAVASWLFDPFARLSTGAGLSVVAAGVLLQVAASRLGVRYDGALDLHVGTAPSWAVTFVEVALDLFATAAIAWAAARIAAARPRLVDVLVAVGVARLPLVALGPPLLWLLPDPETLRQQALSGEVPGVALVVGLLVLPFLAWFFVLWFRGFKTATGLRGVRLWVASLSSVLVAELASKLALSLL